MNTFNFVLSLIKQPTLKISAIVGEDFAEPWTVQLFPDGAAVVAQQYKQAPRDQKMVALCPTWHGARLFSLLSSLLSPGGVRQLTGDKVVSSGLSLSKRE